MLHFIIGREQKFSLSTKLMAMQNREILSFFKSFKNTFSFFIVSYFILISLFALVQFKTSDLYYSSSKLAPIKNDSNTANSSLNSLSSISSSFGINLPTSNGIPDHLYAIELMKTRTFFNYIVDKYDLLPSILASYSYDKENKNLIFNDEIYDIKNKSFTRNYLGNKTAPSKEVAYNIFINKMFESSIEKETLIVTLNLSHHSPVFAQNLLKILIFEADDKLRTEDIALNENLVTFLENKLLETNDMDQRGVFYSIISAKYQEQALIKSRKNYVFRVLDPPNLPEFKYYPSRLVNMIIATIIYGFIYILFLAIITYLEFEVIKERRFIYRLKDRELNNE